MDRAGLVGVDGATHQGLFDLAFLRVMPGLSIAAPADGEALGPLLGAALETGAPFALRFTRGTLPEPPTGGPIPRPLPTAGGARWLQQSPSAVLTIAALCPLAWEATPRLSP